MNRCFSPIGIDEIGKNQDKLINGTSVSSISTDSSIQSISIKSDLPILTTTGVLQARDGVSRKNRFKNQINCNANNK